MIGNLMEDEEKIKYLVMKVLGGGAVNLLHVSSYAIWPAQGVALMYIFAKKYYKEKKSIAGFSREELEEDVVLSDMEIKKLKKEKKSIEERIKRISGKKDEEANSSLRVAEYELKSVEKRLSDFLGRREFDEMLLIMLEHREALEKKGVWKELQPPKKFVKLLDKEQKRIENAEISFAEFSGYMRIKLDETLRA